MPRKDIIAKVTCFIILISTAIIYLLCFGSQLNLDRVRTPSFLKGSQGRRPLDINAQYGLRFNISCSENSVVSEDNVQYLKHALSEGAILARTDRCEEYFTNFHVEAMFKEAPREAQDKRNIILAISHQVHQDIGILEAFLAIIFR